MMIMLAESGLLGQILMVIAVALLIGLTVINMRKRQTSRAADKLDPREKLARMEQTSRMKSDLRQMMVELEELTRRFSAQLDAKSHRLERLIDEADQRIAQLTGERGATRSSNPSHDDPDAAAAPDPAPPIDRPRRSPRVMGKPQVDQPATVELDPLSRQVYELSDAGRSAIDIARDLDEQIGKVELILALRQQV